MQHDEPKRLLRQICRFLRHSATKLEDIINRSVNCIRQLLYILY